MEATKTTGSRARVAELVALYILLPALPTLARLRFHSFPVIPVLWLAMAPIAVWLVRRRGFAPPVVPGVGDAVVAERRVAAACFSFCHVFFLNVWALLLTFVGGILFWRTYEKTGSLFLANLEHTLYGDLVFTIGSGGFLYHGTLALVGSPG